MTVTPWLAGVSWSLGFVMLGGMVSPLPAGGQQAKATSLEAVVMMLKGKVPPSRITSIVAASCQDFAVTFEVRAVLVSLGATQELMSVLDRRNPCPVRSSISVAAQAVPLVYVLDNLVLNPAGTNGARYLLFTVAFEVGSPSLLAVYKSRDAEVRDLVLTVVGAKSSAKLADITYREQLKAEIIGAMVDRFGVLAVRRVLFPQFVVQ